MSYIIPKDELSLAEMRDFRAKALENAINRAIAKIGGRREEFVVRQWLNAVDTTPGLAPLEQWNTAPLLVVGTPYSLFQNQVTVTPISTKFTVFYGVAIETVPVPVSRLEFRHMAVGGNMIAEFDLERIATSDTLEGYFSMPVPIDPNQTFAAQAICRIATGVFARMRLMNFVIEPAGTIIS